MADMFAFILGAAVGATLGVLGAAMCVASSDRRRP